MSVPTYTVAGTKATTSAKLDKTVFGVVIKSHELLKHAYTTYLANGRRNLAVAKTRGDVRGGGKKPWKQKGTGRARFGSTRNPIWRGGGVAFGPTGEETYTKAINTKAKRLAIRQALSLAAEDNKIVVIKNVKLSEAKTSELSKLMKKVDAETKILLVVDHKTEELTRAAHNLAEVKVVQATYINVFDALNANRIVITEPSLKAISDWLGGDK